MTAQNKIKILYIVPHGSVAGGAEHSLVLLLKNLNRERFHPVVILPEGPMRELLHRLGIKTYASNTNYLWFPNKRYYYSLLHELKDRVKQVAEILEKEDVDIIHTNDYWALDGGLASSLTGVPHLWNLRCALTNTHPLFAYFPLQPATFARIINELSDVVVTVSNYVKNSLKPYIPEEKIKVVYNGEDSAKFEEGAGKGRVRSELGISDQSLVVTSIGRISWVKGFEDFVECAGIVSEQSKDVKFLLVGPADDDMERAAALERRVKEIGLADSFFFLGRKDDVPSILAESDIFVSSSISEGLPRVCLEAMACGKPVVATKSGGAEELVIDGETGYLVGVNRPDELARAVLRLMVDERTRSRMGVKGKERVVEFFGLTTFVKNFESLYSQVCTERSRQKPSPVWPELLVNSLSEIGALGLKSLEHEQRLNQLENFMAMFKNNFIYRGAKKVYRAFRSISENKVDRNG